MNYSVKPVAFSSFQGINITMLGTKQMKKSNYCKSCILSSKQDQFLYLNIFFEIPLKLHLIFSFSAPKLHNF